MLEREVTMVHVGSRRFVTACLFVLVFAASAAAQDEAVWVLNFPEVQTVTGRVGVSEPVPANGMVVLDDVPVTTVGRHQTTRLVAGGTVEAGPFTAVVLSLGGFVEGMPAEPATLGAVLVPDEEFVLDALKEGVYLFPIEVTLEISKDSNAYVGTPPELHQLAFPRYRVYYWNSGQRTVKAHLFAFLKS